MLFFILSVNSIFPIFSENSTVDGCTRVRIRTFVHLPNIIDFFFFFLVAGLSPKMKEKT